MGLSLHVTPHAATGVTHPDSSLEALLAVLPAGTPHRLT